MSPLARSRSFDFTLRDKTTVTIRPVIHSDLSRLCGLAAKARAEVGMGRSTPFAARAFNEVGDVDPDDFSWIATAARRASNAPIATASYHRCKDRTTAAWASVAVDSSYQRRGLGTVLLGKLAGSARDHGIECFLAQVVLPTEEAVRNLVFERLGLRIKPLGNRRLQLECEIEALIRDEDRAARLFTLLSPG